MLLHSSYGTYLRWVMQLLNNVRQKGQEFKAANLAGGRRDGSGKIKKAVANRRMAMSLSWHSTPILLFTAILLLNLLPSNGRFNSHPTAESTPILLLILLLEPLPFYCHSICILLRILLLTISPFYSTPILLFYSILQRTAPSVNTT